MDPQFSPRSRPSVPPTSLPVEEASREAAQNFPPTIRGLAFGHELIKSIVDALTPDNYTPENLIEALKSDPLLARLFCQIAVREGYSVEEHTLMVLRQFERYFADFDLPTIISRSEFRLLLSLHDIGKGASRDRGEQHQHTLEVLDALRRSGLFTNDSFNLIGGVSSTNTLGSFFFNAVARRRNPENKVLLAQQIATGECDRKLFEQFFSNPELVPKEALNALAEQAAANFNDLAQKVKISPPALLELILVYYQCDTLAYTFDAARDRSRSSVLSVSEIREIIFSDDLIVSWGEGKISECYANLEADCRSNKKHFPPSRGYPSLDHLYRLDADFDPNLNQEENRMFAIDTANHRVAFSEAIEECYRALEKRIVRAN